MRVWVLISEGAQLLDVAGPAQVIETARLLGAPYELHFTGIAATHKTRPGLRLADIEPLPAHVDATDWIIVAAQSNYDPLKRRIQLKDRYGTTAEVDWLRRAGAASARMTSVCSGTFALGEAGLLDGRRCTTHWLGLDGLRKRFPLARVVDNVLFVDDGDLVTSAGVAASIDMTLHLIGRDHGPKLALEITRGLVLYQRRESAEAELSVHLNHRMHVHNGVHRVQDWLTRHVDEAATLEDLAKIARMSVRSLTREFRAAAGVTILEFREKLRLEQAQTLAARPELTLEEVAYRCGFGGSRQLRRVWRKHHGSRTIRVAK